jgi:hypothetical protein
VCRHTAPNLDLDLDHFPLQQTLASPSMLSTSAAAFLTRTVSLAQAAVTRGVRDEHERAAAVFVLWLALAAALQLAVCALRVAMKMYRFLLWSVAFAIVATIATIASGDWLRLLADSMFLPTLASFTQPPEAPHRAAEPVVPESSTAWFNLTRLIAGAW